MAVADEGRISSASAVSHRDAVERRLGPGRYATFLERLSDRDRAQWLELTTVGWLPIDFSDRTLRVAAEVAGAPYEEFRDEIVGMGVESNYRTVWRILLSVTTDAALIARASAMVHRVYDRGEVDARMVGPGHAEMNIRAWPEIPDRALHGVRVAIQRVLELSRRREVHVIAKRMPDGARYQCTWRA